MKTIFQCEFCRYQSKGDTIGDKNDIEDHELNCPDNPKNLTIEFLIGKYLKLIVDYGDDSNGYDNGVKCALRLVIEDLQKVNKR